MFKKKFLLCFSFVLCLSSLSIPGQTFAKDSKYHIKVNRQTNSATVYELNKKGKYEPIKAMLVSTGGKLTPLGTFYTPAKYIWRPFFAGTFGHYSTRITGPFLLHSIPYEKPSEDTMVKGYFQKLGSAASEGCVRLSAADSKWIYENCELGTKVTIYEDKNPGPLGKPEPVPYEKDNGYDPTDIWAKRNPILKKKPKITFKGSITVLPDDPEIDFFKGVKATSSQGDDLTDEVEVNDEEVNYGTPGKYRIFYTVTDSFGKTAKAKRTIIIK